MAIVIEIASMYDFVGDTNAYASQPDVYLVITAEALSGYFDLLNRSVPKLYWKIADGVLAEMSGDEKAAADASNLPTLKDAKIAEIEAHTDELTSYGFEFPPSSGVRFSLDLTTRTLLLGMVIGKDFLSYPVVFNSRDQRSVASLAGPDDVVAFYGTALLTVKALEDSGTQLKQLVRAATNKSDLDAIVDSR